MTHKNDLAHTQLFKVILYNGYTDLLRKMLIH